MLYPRIINFPLLPNFQGAMMSICFKEKLKLPKDVLDNIITNCEQDIRLILNHLSMLAANNLTDIEAIKKHTKLVSFSNFSKCLIPSSGSETSHVCKFIH